MNRNNNRHLNYKKEKGAISLFVVLSMLFFIVFVVGSYTMISRKSQQQAESNAELKNAYVRDGKEQYDAIVGDSGNVIPIRNKQDFYKIGTGAEIIDTNTGFSYIATPNAEYSIKSTISIPMEEIAGFKGDATDNYKFKDFTIFGKTDTSDTNEYKVDCEPGADIVYTLNGEIYKLVVYSSSGNKTAPTSNYSYLDNEFYIYKDTAEFSAEPHEYLLYLSDNTGTFKELKADENFFGHDVYGGVPSSSSLNGMDKISKSYFLFVKYEKSSAVIGKYLSDVVNVGDYVNYRLDYSSLLTDPNAADAKTGWRVVSKEYDKTKNKYIIKLISEGAPIKYSATGTNGSDDITNFDKAVYDEFESTVFTAEKNGVTVKGEFFKNAYADSIQSLNYQTLSMAITEDPSVDYIEKLGKKIEDTDIREYNGNTLIGYKYNVDSQKITKKGLLDIDKSYWIGKVSTNTNDIHYVKYETNANKKNSITKLGTSSSTFGIRPVVTLIDNIIVIANDDGKAGTGTKENPYNIKISNKHVSGASVGDYVVYTSDTTSKYNYSNVKVRRDDGVERTSSLTGWRILDIADDGTIRLISAGVPLLYSLKDNKGQEKTADVIKEELINNFKQTDFTSSTGTTVKGDFLLNPEYASDIATLSYQDLSYAVYDNEDYIKVSENEKWITDNAEFSEANKKNTIADANFKKVINDWTNRKTNLFTVGTDYIITNDATKAFVFQNKDDKNDANLTTVNKWNHSLNANSKVGLRVVVTLKKTTKFLTGTGTKLDPYVLSANVTGDMAPFKVGDYVTYTGIASYINVSSLSDSGGKNVTQTGWRVLSYNSSTKSLRLVSAGVPYYATAFNLPSITAKDYATYIKQLQFGNLDIKDAAGNKLNASNSLMTKDTRIKAVEALDYDQYCNLIKLYNNREISKDMIYLNQYYWLGSYYEYKVKDVVGYRLRYVTTSADSSLAEQKTYGIRPVIELKTGFTVEAHSGTASDPHVLKY